MPPDHPIAEKSRKKSSHHFFFRGLAISLPPVLTLLILLWILGGINDYIIRPISGGVRWSIAVMIDRSEPTRRFTRDVPGFPPLRHAGRNYVITHELRDQLRERLRERERERLENNAEAGPDVPVSWVEQRLDAVYVPVGDRSLPYVDYARVAEQIPPGQMPNSAVGMYMELVTIRYFGREFLLSAVALIILIVLLYFLGRLVTVRLGAWAVHKAETMVLAKLPLISNVYSSVKQVTDFVLSERKVEYSRVVAIEYPRRGIWSLGFVTGDSMLEMTTAAGEPLVSVLIPSSPMPVTGYTMNVPRSEVLDLNITIDQAFQFCVSCGVLVPPQQKVTPEILQQELSKRLSTNGGKNGGKEVAHSSASVNSDGPSGTT